LLGTTFAPGDIGTAGLTTITGNYAISGGTLAIDLGGTTAATAFQGAAAEYDKLSVTGGTTLGGLLSLNLTNSYVPLAATNHNIIVGTTAGATGSFTNQVTATGGNSRVVLADGLSSFLIATNTSGATASVCGLTGVTARTTALGGYSAINTYSGAGTAWDTASAAAWSNFDPGATTTPVTQASGATAQFADATVSTGAISVSLNSTRNVQGLQFSSTSGSRAYTISSGALVLDNAGSGAAATISDSSTPGTTNAISVPITLNNNLAMTVTKAANTLTLGGAIDGSGKSVTKTGAGALVLSGANTYTGTTTVSNGTAIVSGSLSGTTSVSVAAGAILASCPTGSIVTAAAGNVSVTGNLAPGGSTVGAGAGTLNLSLGTGGKLNFAPASTLLFGLGTTSDLVAFNTGGDWLSGSGNATLQLDVTLVGFNYANTYTVFNNVTTDGFTFANIAGYDTVNYTANFFDAGDSYQLSFVAVPEPGSLVSLLGGLGMLVGLRRMRRRSS